MYALVPIYGRGAGLDIAQVSIWMAAIIFGGFALAWPVGRLSDRIDRRWILLVVCLVLAAASATLAATGGEALRFLFRVGAVHGGRMSRTFPTGVRLTKHFPHYGDPTPHTSG